MISIAATQLIVVTYCLQSGSVTASFKLEVRKYFRFIPYLTGARGGAMFEALRYKPEGREINSRWCH
jgi:hypothetical protein